MVILVFAIGQLAVDQGAKAMVAVKEITIAKIISFVLLPGGGGRIALARSYDYSLLLFRYPIIQW